MRIGDIFLYDDKVGVVTQCNQGCVTLALSTGETEKDVKESLLTPVATAAEVLQQFEEVICQTVL